MICELKVILRHSSSMGNRFGTILYVYICMMHGKNTLCILGISSPANSRAETYFENAFGSKTRRDTITEIPFRRAYYIPYRKRHQLDTLNLYTVAAMHTLSTPPYSNMVLLSLFRSSISAESGASKANRIRLQLQHPLSLLHISPIFMLTALCCLGGLAAVAGLSSVKPARSSLLSSRYDLIVWDCDGVLVDSEALLKQGEVEALARLGFAVTEMDCIRMFSGYSPDAAAANFLREMNTPLPENFIRDQIAGSMDLFRRRLQPLMADTIKTLHGSNALMCVASGSPRDRVLLSLEVGGMKDCFPPEHVFTRELVARGKPAPDLFLYAADKMGVSPQRCIVVEDSGAGIDAAKAAGMDCIAYLGGGHAKYDWYKEKIFSYGIPIGYSQEDILKLLAN